MAQAAYVGNHGTTYLSPTIQTRCRPISSNKASRIRPTRKTSRPYPQFSTIGGNSYNGISNYDALQLTLSKRFSHGLQFSVNYTWSKMLDDQDSSGWGSRDGGQIWQDAYNPSLNYALSNFDLPNMFKGDLVYDLPFGKGREFLKSNAIADAFIGGWRSGSTFVFESGMPFTPLIGTNNNSGALSGNWFPNLIGNPNIC